MLPSALRQLALSLPLVAPVLAQEGGESGGGGAAPDPELALELEALVDLETPAQRRKAAAALARDARWDLDQLLVGMRAFGRFAPLESGFASETVPLRVGGEVEETAIDVYYPARYEPEVPAPLLLSFHGTGGEGRHALSYWRGAAEELGMIVVAPSEAGADEGYAFSERERESALAVLRWIRRRANVDENRVYLTGVSRGGHLAWDLALRFPDRFAAIAPMIGGPRIQIQRAQNNLRYAENVAQLSIRDLQGVNDDPGMVFNLRLLFERLKGFGARDAELLLQEGHGHSFDFAAVDWVAFFGSARRDPFPERVVRAVARKGEGRAFFVEVLDLDKDVKEDFQPKVTAQRWNALDDGGRRRYLQELADEHTGRLQVERLAPGSFAATSDGVRRFRLLLPAGSFDPKEKLTVRRGGKTVNRKVKPSKRVLLQEFAERFDRTFLPVGEIEIR